MYTYFYFIFKSNVKIFNMFGKVLSDLEAFQLENDDSCFSASSFKRMKSDEKLFYLMKHLEKSLKFQVQKFFHIKLEVDTKEVELEFSNFAERSINALKLNNHFNLQVFDVHDDGSDQNNSRINRSIKLAVLENEMKVSIVKVIYLNSIRKYL